MGSNRKASANRRKIVAAEAQMLRDANQTDDALAVLKAGIQRFPNNTDLLYDYAMVAEKGNQIDADGNSAAQGHRACARQPACL